MELNVFSERLNELRGSMSQAEFGKMCGISRVTVGFYENGERLPDARILAQIAQACNVTSDYLLGLSDLKGDVQMSNNSFRRSIDKYYHATLNIFFTEEPCCDKCPLLETYARKQCRVTGEYLSDTRFCGYMCPLIIGDEKTNARELIHRE